MTSCSLFHLLGFSPGIIHGKNNSSPARLIVSRGSGTMNAAFIQIMKSGIELMRIETVLYSLSHTAQTSQNTVLRTFCEKTCLRTVISLPFDPLLRILSHGWRYEQWIAKWVHFAIWQHKKHSGSSVHAVNSASIFLYSTLEATPLCIDIYAKKRDWVKVFWSQKL